MAFPTRRRGRLYAPYQRLSLGSEEADHRDGQLDALAGVYKALAKFSLAMPTKGELGFLITSLGGNHARPRRAAPRKLAHAAGCILVDLSQVAGLEGEGALVPRNRSLTHSAARVIGFGCKPVLRHLGVLNSLHEPPSATMMMTTTTETSVESLRLCTSRSPWPESFLFRPRVG